MIAGVSSRASADIIYSTTYSTTATFACGAPVIATTYKNGTCTTDGNSLSITSGGGQTLTVTFVGVSNVPLTATLGTQVVDIGVIQTSLSGPGDFFFREPTFPWWYPLQFSVAFGIQTSVPVFGHPLWYHTVSPTTVVAVTPFNCCFARVDNDAVAPYDLIFANFRGSLLTAGGSSNITAGVGLFATPEPATVVLTATGLFLVAGVAISKRRAA
jgi:hypothetical protein